MPTKMLLGAMGLGGVNDLCVLDPTPPPLSFAKDLNLSPPAGEPISYTSPKHDTFSYFGPS